MPTPSPLNNERTTSMLASTRALIITGFCLVCLVVVPGIIAGVAFNLYAKSLLLDHGAQWLTSIPVQIKMSFVANLIACPILIVLLKALSIQNRIQYLALSPKPLSTLMFWVLITSLFWLGLASAGELLALPEEPFMLAMKYADISTIWIVCFICLSAPIIEECVFRGFLFRRLLQTRLAGFGTVLITSTIFTLIHFQYEITGLILIFVLALYFGIIRLVTSSTLVAIIAHIINNSLSVVALYLLE